MRKTSEYDWNENFEIEGVTNVTPDELEEQIMNKLKKNMIQSLIIAIALLNFFVI